VKQFEKRALERYRVAIVETLESRALLSGYTFSTATLSASLNSNIVSAAAPLVQAVHIADADAETLAKVVAYQNRTLNAPVNVGLGFVVSRIFNRPSDGFYAIGLTSPSEAPVLLLRGTDNAPDIRSDANPRGAGFNQFVDNWPGPKGVKAWLDATTRTAGPVDIVGHSLGGALAQWIAAQYTHKGGQIGRVVTFNSPGISASYARLFNPALSAGVTHYITAGDIVSMAGQAFIAGQYRLAHFSSTNLLPAGATLLDIYQWELTKHTSHVLTSDGGAPPADVTIDDPLPTSNGLNNRSFVYTDAEYTQMRRALAAALGATPGLGNSYRTLPTALGARWSTEVDRPRLFNLIFSGSII
jgi:pimeloyl-ACP methyl ester carboxylesterase